MKRSNIIVMVLLSIIAIYLLIKLLIVDEWNKIDYILLIILLVTGMINSSIVITRKKKKLKE